MAYNIFDWAKEVTSKKGNWNDFTEEDKAGLNPFMLNKVLSMNQDYIELVAYIQRLWLITPEQLYHIYKQFLPNEFVFSKYIKSKNDKANEDIIKAVSEYYKVSNREAKQYLKILTQEEQIQILQSFGTTEDDINKIYGLTNKKTGRTSSERSSTKTKDNGTTKKRGRPSKKV